MAPNEGNKYSLKILAIFGPFLTLTITFKK